MSTDTPDISTPNGVDSGKQELPIEQPIRPVQEWSQQLVPEAPKPDPVVPQVQQRPAPRSDVPFPGPVAAPPNVLARVSEPSAQMKQADEIYCSSCGSVIKKQAVICVHCGVAVQAGAFGLSQPKSKTAAVLLAVFLSFWTWVYTYKRDAWKFWVNLGLSVVTLGIWILVAWPWSIIDVAIKPSEYYQQYPNYRK